jgi:dephospho-CoA kinase
VSREDVLIRMQNQFQEEESLKLTDFVIRNDGSEFIIKQVLDIDEKIKNNGKFC